MCARQQLSASFTTGPVLLQRQRSTLVSWRVANALSFFFLFSVAFSFRLWEWFSRKRGPIFDIVRYCQALSEHGVRARRYFGDEM